MSLSCKTTVTRIRTGEEDGRGGGWARGHDWTIQGKLGLGVGKPRVALVPLIFLGSE